MSIKIDYTQTTWVNEVTPLNAQNMNNIDRALSSIKTALDGKEFSASSVHADPEGTANTLVATHNDNPNAHGDTFAKKVHTHTLSQITNFPANNPTSSDNGKVAIVKSGAWSANKLSFGDITGTLAYSNISDAPTIPTKMSDLTNDVGYVTRGEVDQPVMIEYEGSNTTTINLEFGYCPDHLVIEDFAGATEIPVTTVVDHNWTGSATIVWGDFDVAIVTTVNGQFNETGHKYKVWGYALTSANQVPDGDIIVAEDGQWTHTAPAELGFTTVVANPETVAGANLTKVTIGDATYNVVGTIDDALSSSSTNPVQNKVINSALSGKEASTNKASNFNTLNNTKFPTTQAVANYLTAQISANSASTPTGVLSNIKIGNNIYEIPENTPIVSITATDIASVSGDNSYRQYQFKVSSADKAKITAKANENFILYFELSGSISGEAFAVSGMTVSGTRYFNGVMRNTQSASVDTFSFSLSFTESDTYPFKMFLAYPDRATNSLSDRAVSNATVTSALSGKENTSNKKTDFTTVDNTAYPTTQAVVNYIKGNPTGQTSTVDLTYLKIGNDLYRIPSGASITVDSAFSTTSTNPLQNKVITTKFNSTDTSLGQLTGTVTTLVNNYSSLSSTVNGHTTDITSLQNGKQDKALVTSIDTNSDNTHYPSAKCVWDTVSTMDTSIALRELTANKKDTINNSATEYPSSAAVYAMVQSGTATLYGTMASLCGYANWCMSGKAMHIMFTTVNNSNLGTLNSATLSGLPLNVAIPSTKCPYTYVKSGTVMCGWVTIEKSAMSANATIGIYDPAIPEMPTALGSLGNAINTVLTVITN